VQDTSPTRFYRVLRDQLGSLRNVYGRGNKVVRHDDFARKPEAVLLLHGFFQTRNVWEVMEDRLRYDGYGVFSFDLGGLLSRFNTERPGPLAETIAAKIERICARTGMERFHVVGHSKGGLIAREYVQHHGGDRRVKSLVTLGTPHHGTPTAALGVWMMGAGVLSRSPYDLLPNSRFVQRLRTASFPPGIPLTSIYSRTDIVVPWWSSVLVSTPKESHLSNRPVTGVGHTALTYDPGVYRLVREAIRAAHDAPTDAPHAQGDAARSDS